MDKSKEFKKIMEELSKLKFDEMYENDFLLTWEKTSDEVKATFAVADALRNLRERNISTKIFDSGLGYLYLEIIQQEQDLVLHQRVIYWD